jgi:hypothetical protein
MGRYSARLERRGGWTAGGYSVLPQGVTLVPERWSARDVGGMDTATIGATGTVEDLAHLLTWVGDRAEIANENGTVVWWGVVTEIEASLGGVAVTLSLDSVVNRVMVTYSETLADGSTRATQTAWAQDDNSIGRYGKRELVYALPEGYGNTPTQVRDRILARLADPGPRLETRKDVEVRATLHCRGIWQLLEYSYFTNTAGLVEHTAGGDALLLDAATVSTAVRFAAADDIYAPAGTLTALQPGVTFRVSGAANAGNNGTFTVQSFEVIAGEDHIETIENTQVTAAAGPSITVSLGDQPWVSRFAQSFTVASAWRAGLVAVRVAKAGNPVDDLLVEICASSGGNPGTVLATATLPGTSVPTAMSWVEIPLVPVAPMTELNLATATTYWLVVRRNGGASLVNHYALTVDDEQGFSGGAMKIFAGGTWQSYAADLCFRVVGMVAAETQMAAVLGTCAGVNGELSGVEVGVATGVEVRSYQDAPRTVRQYVEELMDLGTAAGNRLVAWVTPNRWAFVRLALASNPANPALRADGRLYQPTGAPWEPGALVVGRHVNVDGLPVLDGVATRTKGVDAVYIEEAEYDPVADRLILRSEGAIDPWRAVRVRNG